MMTEKTNRVLIIDDHREIREVLSELLTINGYDVISAANGKEGLALLEDPSSTVPCLVLLDLMMPVMNGWDFLDALRNHPRYSAMPVVIVSAYEDRAPHERVQAVLKKPVDFSALLDEVKQYCGPAGDA